MESVRDLIRMIGEQARLPDLQPQQACDLLMSLSGLFGHMCEEARLTDMDYNAVLLTHMAAEKVASHAKIKAKATPEYSRAQAAKDGVKECLQLMQSLKIFVRSKSEEMRLGC